MLRSLRIHFLIIIIIGFLLYLPSLSGPFLWDDEDFVYANHYVANFQIDKFFTQSQTAGRGKASNYFRPIPQIVYATSHTLFGFNAFWFHLVNILVHISAACAVFSFFYFLLKKAGGGEKDSLNASERTRARNYQDQQSTRTSQASVLRMVEPTGPALLLSLFFLIHPVQTEAVSYISGLSDPLFVLFGFLSLIFYLKTKSVAMDLFFRLEGKLAAPVVPTIAAEQEKKGHRQTLFLSLTFFTFSLLSKETALVFLGLILSLELIKQLSHDRYKNVWLIVEATRTTFKKTWAYLAITLAYLWYHFTFINSFDIKAAWGNTPYANSVLVRLLTFIQNLWTYFGLLIFPKDLFMERDFSTPIQTSFFHWPFILSLIFFPLIFYLIRKNKLLLFCFLAFFISFLPYSGIVLINGIFYEHFLYLPLVFFFAFVILFLPKNLLTLLILLTSLTLFAGRNISRQLDWTDAVRFYSQTLSHAPKSIRIINGLGMAYADKGDSDNAIQTYSQGISINSHVPNLYHNLANIYAAQGKFDLAEQNYLQAIAVDPNFIYSWQSLANLYQQTGQTEKLNALISKSQMLNRKW